MYNDKTSNFIWLGTDAGCLIKFNKITGIAKNYYFGKKSSWIERIGKFENKKIWVATGLSRFNGF